MIKAVIFDLDDTLISENDYIKSGYRYISKLLSGRLRKSDIELEQLLSKLFMDSPKNVFNRLLDDLGISYSSETILDLVSEYRNHNPSIEFYSDVLPCVEALRKNEFKIGIISDGYAETQRKKIKAVKAFEYFHEIILTDELGREFWKPHPKAFEMIKDRFKIDFDEMVYVGDNPEKDFFIKTIHPIKTIRILRNGIYQNSSYLENVEEDQSISNLIELVGNLI